MKHAKEYIETYLNEFNSIKTDDIIAFINLFNKNIQNFNGKLYKYFSFEDNFSLSNLENNIIHFSKPQSFNDPFDTIMGFSLNDAAKEFILSSMNPSLDFQSLNNLSEEEKVQLLNSTPSNAKNDTFKLISIILTHPKMSVFIEKIKNNEEVNSEEMRKVVIQILKSPEFWNTIYNDKISSLLNNGIEFKQMIANIEKNSNAIENFNNAEKNTLATINQFTKDIGYEDKIKQELLRINDLFDNFIDSQKNYINSQLAISCFSKTSNNILMWSHYANKHSGFCVEYDFSKLDNKYKNMFLLPVCYSKNRPTVPTAFLKNAFSKEELNQNIATVEVICSFLTKSDIWKYEKEWRIVSFQKDLEDSHLLPFDIVSKIYLGANISPENEEKIRKIAKSKNIPVKKYKIDFEKYLLKLA